MAASNIVQIVIQAMDSASGVFKAIGNSSGQMGDNIGKSMNQATKDMAKAQTAIVGLKDNMVSSIGSMKGLLADFGMIGVGASVAKAADSWADSVYKLRRQVGGTAEDASQLLVIGKYAGIGTDQAVSAFAKFGKAISLAKDEMQKADTEGKTSNDMFTRLGLSFKDLSGKNLAEVFATVADKMRNMEDGADKDRVAMSLFGKTGYEMNEMLSLSKDQIDAVTQAATQSGRILDDETIEAWHRLDKEIGAIGGSVQGFTIQIGNELLPALKGQIDAVNDLIGAHRNLSPEMQKVIGEGIQAIGMFGEYRLASVALSALMPGLGAALTNPWTLAAVAIGIATVKVLDYIETLHKVPSYNEKAEVREIGDDGMGHMLHQKKQQINTFMGLPVYDWVNLSEAEEERQREYDNPDSANYHKTEQQLEAARQKALHVDTPTTLSPPVIGGGGSNAAADRTEERLERAYDKADVLMKDLDKKILEDTGTSYQVGMAKIAEERSKMQGEIDKISQAGVGADVTDELNNKLVQYEQSAADKVKEKWRDAWTDVKNQTALIGAQLLNDKKAENAVLLQIELDRIEKERQSWAKKIKVDPNDAEADNAANNWAKGAAEVATKKSKYADDDDKLKQYQNDLQYDSMRVNLIGQTQAQIDVFRQKDLSSYIAELNTQITAAGDDKDRKLALQKELNDALNQQYEINGRNMQTAGAEAMRRIKAQTHDYAADMETTFNDMASTVEDHFTKMLQGTESFSLGFKGIISDMVAEVQKMLVKMFVNQYVISPLQSLFSGIIGGSSYAVATSGSYSGQSGWSGDLHDTYGVSWKASGGLANGWTVVGEEGPELAYFGSPARIYDANTSKSLLSSDKQQSQPITIHMNINTPDASSFRRSQSQIMAEANAALAFGRRNL